MITTAENELIEVQIRKSHHEILLQNFVFSFANSLSLVFIGLISFRMFFFEYNEKDDLSKYLQGAIALVVPFLTFVGQGYCYPRKRRIEILEHFLFKNKLDADDIKSLYEK